MDKILLGQAILIPGTVGLEYLLVVSSTEYNCSPVDVVM